MQTLIFQRLTLAFLSLGIVVLPGCQKKETSVASKTDTPAKKTAPDTPTPEPESTDKTEKKTEPPVSPKVEYILPPEPPSSEDLAAIEIKKMGGKAETNKNDNVDKVTLAGAEIKDEHLVILKAFPFLNSLDLSGTPITDAGLKHLKELRYLRYLYLLGTNVTDAGVAELQGLSRLEQLCLDGTQVSDAGVKNLEPLSRLVMVHLVTQKDITDACIDSLIKLKELKEIKIEGTKITQDGRARLEKALPEIEFIGGTEEGIPID